MRFITAALLALATAIAVAPAHADGIEQVLPEDTILLVTAPDTAKSWARLKESSMWAIWQEPSVQKFYEKVRSMLETEADKAEDVKSFRARFKEKVGVDLAEAHTMLKHGQASFALVDLKMPEKDEETPRVDLLIAIDYDAESDTFSRLIDFVVEELKKEEAQVSVVKIGEVDVKVITPPKDADAAKLPQAFKICLALKGGRFYATTNTDTMKRMLESSKPGKSLALCPQYVACRKGTQATDEIAFAYLNLKALWARVDGSLGEWKERLETLGVFGIEALAASTAFHGKGVRDQFFISMPGERKGVQRMLTLPKTQLKALRYAPATAGAFSSSGFDIKAVYDEAMRIFKTLAPEQFAEFEEDKGKAEKRLEMSFADLAASLGTEFSTFSRLASKGGEDDKKQPGLGDLMRSTYILSLSDAKKFEAGLVKLLKEFELEVESKDAHGMRVNIIKLPTEGDAPIKNVGYSIHDGMLFVAIPGDDLITLAKEQATGAPGLSSTAKFSKLLKAYPEGFAGFGYTDLPAYLRMLWDFAKPMLEDQLRAGDPLTMKDLPDIEAIAKHLGPMLSVVYSDKAGLRVVYDSPMGSVASLMVVAAGAAIAIPAMNQAQVSAKRAACTAQLKQIGVGMLSYHADKKAYPEELIDLVSGEKKYLPGGKPFVSPADPFPMKEGDYEYSYVYVYSNKLGAATPDKTIVAYNKQPVHNDKKARNVLFLDGHVETIDETKFRALFKVHKDALKKLGIEAYIGWGKLK